MAYTVDQLRNLADFANEVERHLSGSGVDTEYLRVTSVGEVLVVPVFRVDTLTARLIFYPQDEGAFFDNWGHPMFYEQRDAAWNLAASSPWKWVKRDLPSTRLRGQDEEPTLSLMAKRVKTFLEISG